MRGRRAGDERPPALPPQMYHVLLALGDEVLHGYGIVQSFEALTGGEATLLPGSLYATLGRMVELGYLEEAPAPPGEASGGPPRRYYRMTAEGRAAVRAEAARQARLVEVARVRGLAAEGGAG